MDCCYDAGMTPSEIQHALQKRGFRLDDARPHECADCGERAMLRYVLRGNRLGGRDITLCTTCGKVRSWRSAGGLEERKEDTSFDVEVFLR